MGFDPMTHRPRTDFFAALPQLIALANLRQLIQQSPWDDHTARLQAEAMQAAKIQYLSSLLGSAPGMINATASPSLTPSSTTQDLNPLSLLNSPQMTPLPSMHSPTNPIPNQLDQIPDAELLPSYLFEQLLSNDPNLSGDFSTGPGINGEGSSTPRTVLGSQSSLPPLTDISISNLGDACSTSSCDLSSTSSIPFWGSDILLDDQCFMPEFS